ncbi:M1 family peptidase, partial [Pimelobacter simplex]|nr:M1 family peptidase [Pimelobacter simplex]
VGDEAFFGLLKAWATERRGASVTTSEFLDFAGERTGADVAGLLGPWLYETALPGFPQG